MRWARKIEKTLTMNRMRFDRFKAYISAMQGMDAKKNGIYR